MAKRPLGIFDSGLGGLSVAREVRRRLPQEDVLYLADSAYCPYGGRPLGQIRERSIAVTGALIEHGAKLVVAACNTASGAAIEQLRERFDVPIVGLEPAVKPAAASSAKRRFAVLATPATLITERFHRLLDNHGSDVEVIKLACPGFVELVEAGELSGDRAITMIREVLEPLRDADIDRVVLGCTHYPFLRDAIAHVLGDGVEILDSGAAVARQVERVLTEEGIRELTGEGTFRAFTTGDPLTVGPVIDRLWDGTVEVDKVDA
ncbi:MAG: glutamate racemase [Gemmatimonadota bacterium]